MPGHSGSKDLLIIMRDAYALSEDVTYHRKCKFSHYIDTYSFTTV